MGALAITHNPKYRAPFEPLPGDVTFVPYGDVEALAAEVAKLDALAGGVRNPTLDGLRAHLFTSGRLRPARRDYYDPRNSFLDHVLERPARVEVRDAEHGVLGDRARALVRVAARVVVHRVSCEVRGDGIGVAAVERLVVGADVVRERSH